MMTMPRFLGLLLCFAMTLTSGAIAGDWARFRGPNGSGVNRDSAPTPVQWSETENLKWKVELPGPGHSCPIVVGDRVFVTCWSGYGTDRQDPGDPSNLKRHLLCVDRNSGQIVWNEAVDAVLPEDRYGGMFAEHGYASHTPVSDGEHVYAFFGKTGVVAFDMDGNQIWQTSVGTELDGRRWGSASSPILYKNMVIVTAAAESQALVALDTKTGKEVWRAEAEGIGSTWGTPIVVEVDQDRTDIVLAVPYEIWGFNPDTGKLRWYCEAIGSNSMCASAIAHDGIVYAMESGGRGGGGAVAVRVGGKGNVTETNIVWSNSARSRIGTPVYSDGRIYWVSRKIANCIDATSGEEIFQDRLTGGAAPSNQQPGGRGGGLGGFRRGGRGGGQDYASPVAADGKLYYVTRNGDMYVLALGDEFKQLSVNRFASDDGEFSASPAIANGELFIRSTKNLYCVAQQ